MPSLTSRTKNDKSYNKSPKTSSTNDGLETGSDSDAVEEVEFIPHISKFTSNTKVLETRVLSDTLPASFGHTSKSYDSNSKSFRESYDDNLKIARNKEDKYSVNLPKPNILSSDPLKNDINDRDSSKTDDILSSFETPYLSEFTRRLSSRTSINLPSASKPSIKGK